LSLLVTEFLKISQHVAKLEARKLVVS